VVSEAGLNAVAKRNIYCSCRNSNSVQLCIDWGVPAPGELVKSGNKVWRNLTEMHRDISGSKFANIRCELVDLPTVEHLNNWASCTSSSATAGGAAGVQYIPSFSTSLPDILWKEKKKEQCRTGQCFKLRLNV
jgi:hypothetical protein